MKTYDSFVSSDDDHIGKDGVPADELEENNDDDEIVHSAADIMRYVS